MSARNLELEFLSHYTACCLPFISSPLPQVSGPCYCGRQLDKMNDGSAVLLSLYSNAVISLMNLKLCGCTFRATLLSASLCLLPQSRGRNISHGVKGEVKISAVKSYDSCVLLGGN